MKRSLIRPIALSLLVTVAPTLSGCFGSFGATRLIYEINRDLFSNKILQWIVFLVFASFQVYSIAATIDVILLNLIEFWTGSNPLVERGEEVPERVVQLDDDTLLVMNRDAADKLSFEVIERGNSSSFGMSLESTGAVLSQGGVPVGVLHAGENGVSVYDGEGQLLDSVSPIEQEQAIARLQRNGAAGIIGWHRDRTYVTHGLAIK